MFYLFLGIFFLYDGKLCVTKVACFVVQFSTISRGGPVVFYTTNREIYPRMTSYSSRVMWQLQQCAHEKKIMTVYRLTFNVFLYHKTNPLTLNFNFAVSIQISFL